MIEVEVKARAPPDLEQRILALGASPLAVETHRDIYLNGLPCDRDFARTDEALRIRIKEQGAFLTYKGPKLDSLSKSRQEITVQVDDPSAAEALLSSLGFVRSMEVRKVRRKYRLGDLVIALDQVEGLGSFVEVEVMALPADWEGRRQEVLDLLSRLGAEEHIRASYLELMLQRKS
ncbi:MAG: class IV adenylate cyclase [Methanosarcinales archaeon]|nr:class IV adenylate cyclase [Methanosarcinales archaeon]